MSSINQVNGIPIDRYKGLLSPLRYECVDGKLGSQKVSWLSYKGSQVAVLFRRLWFLFTTHSWKNDAALFHDFNIETRLKIESKSLPVDLFQEFINRNLSLKSLSEKCRKDYRENIEDLREEGWKDAKEFCQQAERFFKVGNNRVNNALYHPGFEGSIFDDEYEQYCVKKSAEWDIYNFDTILNDKKDKFASEEERFKAHLKEVCDSFRKDALDRSTTVIFNGKIQIESKNRLAELITEIRKRYVSAMIKNKRNYQDQLEKLSNSEFIKGISKYYEKPLEQKRPGLSEEALSNVLSASSQITKEEAQTILTNCRVGRNEIPEVNSLEKRRLERLVRAKILQMMLVLQQSSVKTLFEKVKDQFIKINGIGPTHGQTKFEFNDDLFDSFTLNFKLAIILTASPQERVLEHEFSYDCFALNDSRREPTIRHDLNFNRFISDNALDVIIPTILSSQEKTDTVG